MSESIGAVPPFVDAPVSPHVAQGARPALRPQLRPTAREWLRHAALLLLTLLTTTFAGVVNSFETDFAEPAMRAPSAWFDYVLYVPEYYLKLTGIILRQAFAEPHQLIEGAAFGCALLSILAAHEAGHYIACRRYRVAATLPFFIPAPPLFLAGTFGAFIKIRSPIRSRRALFDIGVAGPLAGFLVILPVAFIGLLTAHHAAPLPSTASAGITFNDPLLFVLMARIIGLRHLANIAPNPFYFAAWIGLLVTSLNLIPVGQLDGGHTTYSIFGWRAHKYLGRLAFLTMCALAVLGWLWHGSPSGFLYTVLLAIMLRVRHPPVSDEVENLGRARIVVAILTLVVFTLSFMPFPITLT